jgi:hypothetical protein
MRVGLERQRRERRVVSQDECEVDSVLWCLCVVLNKLFFFDFERPKHKPALFGGRCLSQENVLDWRKYSNLSSGNVSEFHRL